ncbi:PREDICTED: low-density lipoprotein receptor class A domain-containing protein 4 isoform X1 [Crocodylus porosus]|uniref:Low density lipoprotein receptor class A domain containing 4 n=2 Tax=Crocodylus porosus TaxID=8502 RepID=A0A7M4EJF3_CROPO|nr:PREDICTED: low-density lipoprotein receptor class A domain-containing protein 4 isoform X1 [Crocodylus porosus]
MQEAGFQATNAFTECKFTCTSGKCLHLGSLICNQQNDCGDNSDEENCQLVTEHPPPSIFSSELEFVQIIIIIVVITVMVVVIICLLNHYKLSTRSFINRQSQSRRQEETLQPEGCLWPSENSVSRQGASEIMYAPRSRDRFPAPSFMQRDRFSRFQPTYPYMQHEIDLPPTISLSDGEEPPPYQGPCTLQLRDPEQQMELNRESVRAPPNRTIFDSDLIDISMYNGGPCPPSSNSGISATNYSSNGRMEEPPPTYSEVMGHYPGSSFFHHQHSNAPPSSQRGSRLHFQQNNSESTIVPIKGKDRKPGNLV